ncbi:M24 family metallopeptidase [Bradyrhizobium sp. CCBAU 51627]|uniref:M24 family metallopeptidase n=1 Tax=Bradyrhizobium sp. CCBAU 51627 TaxID=1325088 RepID=UPI0023053941|nr:Xaa-Pro peptidase family protein [Bradyrhizobium sp. CCBAU 51627]
MSRDLTFSIEEYKRRCDAVRRLMAERRLDCVILDEPEMMSWLSGYTVSENLWRACIVPALSEPFLLVRKLDMPPARQRTWLDKIVGFDDWDDPLAVLANTLREAGSVPARIGAEFQSNSFTIQRLKSLRKLLPDTEFCDLERSGWDLRRCKSAEEIAHMSRAGSLLDAAFDTTVREVASGKSQRDIAAAAAAAYYQLGFDDGFVGPLNVGSGWDSLHGFLTERPLVDGDIVHIELLPRLRFYTVRIMRSVIVGRASAEQHAAAQTLIELQDRQIAALRPGAIAADVDRIVREGVVAAGLRETYDNITGYTLGTAPLVSQHTSDLYRCFTPRSEWAIEEGMVFHMYTSAAGLAFSESVVVTSSGGKRLTSIPRKIFETGPK